MPSILGARQRRPRARRGRARRASADVNSIASKPAAAAAATLVAESSVKTVRAGSSPNRSLSSANIARVGLRQPTSPGDQHVLEQPDRRRGGLGEVERLGGPVGQAEEPDARAPQVPHQRAVPGTGPGQRVREVLDVQVQRGQVLGRGMRELAPRVGPGTPGVLLVVERREVDVRRRTRAPPRRPGARRTAGRVPPDEHVAQVEDHGRSGRSSAAPPGPAATRTVPPSRRALRTASEAARARASAAPHGAARARSPARRARASLPSRAPRPARPQHLERPAGRPGGRGVSTASRGPVTAAMRTAGGSASSARSASSREASPTGSQRTSACVARSSASPTSSTTAALVDGRTSAAAVSQRRSASGSRPQRRPGGAHRGVEQQAAA